MTNLIQKRLFIIFLILLLTVQTFFHASADDDISHKFEKKGKHVHGTHLECSLPDNTQDIINCALMLHPSIRKTKYKLDTASKLIKKASQIPNPSLNSRYVKGNQNSELESNLLFNLELGGKRKSRKKYAESVKNEVVALQEQIKAEVKILTVLNLYRLRQIFDEKRAIDETLHAFSRVIKQLKELPRLTAEQEGSLILFQMAYEEAKFQKSEIFEEERKLEHYFHVATGHSLKEIKPFLPKPPKVWPKINSHYSTNEISPEVKKLKSTAKIEENYLKIQKSESWPNLKLGPSFSFETDNGTENKMFGLNVQIPIQIFHANDGGKSYAKKRWIEAKKNVEITQSEESHERFEQSRIYESSVHLLNQTMNKYKVGIQQDKLEMMYLRGVISSSIFLESLKQKLSYLKSRNKREMAALKALWNIYKFNGKVLGKKI